jgi:cobalt-zinc-cadmium resistance protein CzcA
MTVRYDRSKIARYGLNIELNDMIALGFAGKTVGNVFEGEKRFDMVIRLDQSNRRDINDLKNLYVTTPNGEQIPLQELASIEYTEGPPKFPETTRTEELWLELMCETETCKAS